MSPTRFRCANSLLEFWPLAPVVQQANTELSFRVGKWCFSCVCASCYKFFFSLSPPAQNKKLGGSGYRSRFSTLRRLYATMYNNPPNASFGTRTRTYTLEGCNSTLKLRMRAQRWLTLVERNRDVCTKRVQNCAKAPVKGSVVVFVSQTVEWPSGLRRSTQVRVSSEAWVQIPPEPYYFWFTSD